MQGVSESSGDIAQSVVGVKSPCGRYPGWGDSSLFMHCNLLLAVVLFRYKEEKEVTTGRFLVLWRVKRTGDLFTLTVGGVFGLKSAQVT